MLIQFSVSNFRSFRDTQTLSLVRGRDKSHPDNSVDFDGTGILKTAALYGANASGKSNLIKAIQAMSAFVLTSASRMTQGDPISWVAPFKLAAATRKQPSTFAITILIDDTRYDYRFAATHERVQSESLVAYPPDGRKQRWFERTLDPTSGETKWEFRGPLTPVKAMLRQRTRDNGLVLSRGAELNVDALSKVFLWFKHTLEVYDLSTPFLVLQQETARAVARDSDLRAKVVELLQHADLAIRDISVAKRPFDVPESVRKFFSAEALAHMASDDDETARMSIRAEHVGEGGSLVDLDFEREESNGTQRLFSLAGPVLQALADGRTLVIDELDASMHPVLTRKLVELFQSPQANGGRAQLIFATHDTTLLDASLFRRDQIWLAERDREGASSLFSLYDFPTDKRPRKAEALQRNYLEGRYGGVPSLGPIFEDLEIK